jgi:hypothetical protein
MFRPNENEGLLAHGRGGLGRWKTLRVYYSWL